jgi:1-pyrroline-5-carboxylate dehydrogenase
MAVTSRPAPTHADSDATKAVAAPRSAPLAGFSGTRRVPPPTNEPIKGYAPGSPERAALKSRLAEMAGERVEMPIIIGGEDVHTGELLQSVMPHNHKHVLGDWHKASAKHVHQAIDAARTARADWGNWAWEDRAAVFLKAGELLATTWRSTLNAATMLGQSKTAFQAEIDAACELIDFWRFNPAYAQELYDEQPMSNNAMWNQLDYRPLEGFVYAVTPFNFTSIGGNLPTAPALMGNTVIWKPASSSMLSSYYLMRLLEEAGLPPGVINLVPGDAAEISNILLSHRELAGVHFTGSTGVFNSMWKTIGANMSQFATYPRIVGETGGKDFIVAHPSADPEALAVAIARGGFEYQGQKCSAASRVYIPRSLWKDVRDRTVAMMDDMRMGTSPTSATSSARSSMRNLLRRSASTSTTPARTRRSSRAASPRATKATSSSRRWSRRRSLATACCARRSLDPSSRRTSMTTPHGARRSRSSTRRRRTR